MERKGSEVLVEESAGLVPDVWFKKTVKEEMCRKKNKKTKGIVLGRSLS